jgi:hypothetical protein
MFNRLRKYFAKRAEMRHVARAIAGKAPLLEHEAEARAARLGERLRLAQQIADEAARAEIECNCAAERLGTRSWYDTKRSNAGGDPVYFEGVQRALRYLDLRGRVIRHPVQIHLVRFQR